MHNQLSPTYLARERETGVRHALAEDLGQPVTDLLDPSRDLTAQLVPAHSVARATIVTRETTVLCGQAWVNEVFRQLSDTTRSSGEVSIH